MRTIKHEFHHLVLSVSVCAEGGGRERKEKKRIEERQREREEKKGWLEREKRVKK